MIKLRVSLVILLTVVLSFLILNEAVASPVTFNFQGIMSYVDANFSNSFSIGQALTGSYTFESTTTDSNVLSNVGIYNDALSSLSFNTNGYTGTFVENLNDRIEVANNLDPIGVDGYDVVGNFTGATFTSVNVGTCTPSSFVLNLIDFNGTALSNDSLPLVPPKLSDFETKVFGFSFSCVKQAGRGGYGGSVSATLTSLVLATPLPPPPSGVPEPSSLLLLSVGIAGFRLFRKRLPGLHPIQSDPVTPNKR